MPNSARNVMGAGISALAALAENGFLTDNLTATGSTQVTAFQMSADTSVFTTVAAGTGALLTPAAIVTPGDEMQVANLGANALLVYPPLGGNINGGATNVGFSIPVGKTAALTARVGGLNWIAVLSA